MQCGWLNMLIKMLVAESCFHHRPLRTYNCKLKCLLFSSHHSSFIVHHLSSSSSSWHQSNLRTDYLEAEMDGAHIYAWGWKLSSVLAQKNEESWWRWNKKPQPRKEKMKFWCLHSYLGMFISNSCYFDSFDKQSRRWEFTPSNGGTQPTYLL